MEQKFEQERDELRARLAETEKKLQERTQELGLTEQTLAARSSEFESLQANNKELEELREMKEVRSENRGLKILRSGIRSLISVCS
jgi:hypothetical protein